MKKIELTKKELIVLKHQLEANVCFSGCIDEKYSKGDIECCNCEYTKILKGIINKI